jgi:dipeptidyl aminopeptidase/acylaminoacyl peptidase
LNGEKDERTDPGQARHLAEEITRHGGYARAIIYPDQGHQIPIEVRDKDIDPFIDRILKSMLVPSGHQADASPGH